MREETETIRTYCNADPRKEWDRLMIKGLAKGALDHIHGEVDYSFCNVLHEE